jgi:nucleolar pre-ribosomal-associated protein 1
MGKRPANEVEDGDQAYLKRQKISNPGYDNVGPTTPAAAAEKIRSGKHLGQTLAFDQDSGRAKHGNTKPSATHSLANMI